jgi:hypothetical protein
MLICSIFIYLFLSFFVTARSFFVITFSKWIITFFLLTVCVNILVSEILHFLKLLNNSWLFLVIQLLLSVIVFIFIWDPKKKVFKESCFPIKFQPLKLNLIDSFLTFVIIAILIGVLYVGTLSPINNSDSLHTHLPRIYYWLQHGSFANWNAITVTQISYPLNISIQGLWIFLFGKSEMLFFLVPWLGLLVAVILIFEISQLLGATIRGSLVASLVTLTFPVVLLQSYSYQGDVFVTALVLMSVYFVLLFMKNKSPRFIFLSGLAFSVSIGSKQTAILMIPVYLLVLLILFLKKELSFRFLLQTVGLTLVFFIFFSSFKFIQDLTEKSLGDDQMIEVEYYENLRTVTSRPFEGYTVNFLRYFYQSISLDGLTGKLRIDAGNIKNEFFRSFTKKIGLDLETKEYLPVLRTVDFSYDNHYAINEDATWFGPLFYPFLLISCLVVLFSKNKLARNYLLIGCIVAAIFMFGQVVLKTAWSPNRGRHMTIAVLTLVPLVAFLIPKNRFFSGATSVIIAFCSLLLASSILVFNDSRPLVRKGMLTQFSEGYVAKIKVTNIFNSQYRKRLYDLSTDLILTAPSRATILKSSYAEKLYYQNTYEIPNLKFVNQYIPVKDRLYLLIDKALLEYGLFGKNKTRDLFPISDYHDVASDSYLLIRKDKKIIIPEFELIGENDDYLIYYRP